METLLQRLIGLYKKAYNFAIDWNNELKFFI